MTSMPVSEGVTESAVRIWPNTVQGCRPTSVVTHPASTATKPSGAAHWHARRKHGRPDECLAAAHDVAYDHERQHENAHADHDAKGIEGRPNRGPLVGRPILQALDLTGQGVRQ